MSRFTKVQREKSRVKNSISISKLSSELQDILNNNVGIITENVKVLAKDITEELVKNTKKASPKKTGEYKRHINYKKTRETSTNAVYTWYVKDPEYRLTHLIANGHKHIVGAGKGNKTPIEVGRINGNFPLAKNVIEAETKFVKGVKEIIENEC